MSTETAQQANDTRPRPSSHLDRDEAIARLRAALRRRTGKAWSVTGGRGTAWGWIEIHVRPAQRTQPYEYMTEADRDVLGGIFGALHAHVQGVQVSPDERGWFVARAEGTR